MPDPSPDTIASFISRWEQSGGSEKANYALFLTELCDQILLVPHPEPASPDNAKNRYVFERTVLHKDSEGFTSSGFIDLYKAGCFVLETKQGTFRKAQKTGALLDFIPAATSATQKSGHGKRGTAAFDKVLQRAYLQARNYITALPATEGRPPFLIVCDVGHSIELYAEFSGTGGQYERFPDPVSHRITLADLRRPEIRERLRRVWTDPESLDPSKHAAAVTRKVAAALAELAKSLEKDGHDAKVTAGFLQRCLFTMFAEDIGLLPGNSFLQLLEKVKDQPVGFPVVLQNLWRDMAHGTPFSTVLMGAVPHFNGGLFEDTTALPLRPDQMALLIHAAQSDWAAVEPAIFGTLVERALDPRERHKLGAHYTPRSYVERLIRPALINPLRAEWDAVKAAAILSHEKAQKAEAAAALLSAEAQQHIQARDKSKADALNKKRADLLKTAKAEDENALTAVRDFHRHLCTLRVLDPACGCGNFLYVSLELMKRLEAEVLEALDDLGGDAAFEMASFKIGPRQFLGLELNRRAVAIAQLVLWIGFFQWQRRTTGKADTNERPLLPKEATIIQQDAVLAYDTTIARKDPATGQDITIWDGHTTKPHPVTGKPVPDDSARRAVLDYTNPRRATWPEADVIVGNPPFIGASRMRDALGDGYTETLRSVWKGSVPESADFVMFWWQKAAELLRDNKIQRFGFITTNSIHQTFNRRVIEPFLADDKKPLHLSYAISDHPWVDSADGADVRISLTVAEAGQGLGTLWEVVKETPLDDGENDVELLTKTGVIASNLQVGAPVASAIPLLSNQNLSSRGMMLFGSGFIIDVPTAKSLGLGIIPDLEKHVRTYRNGRDLADKPRHALVIDLFGLSPKEVETKFPELYQHVWTAVKPERDLNKDKTIRENWWIHGRPRPELRAHIAGLRRFIATVETSKHRYFTFLNESVIPDNKLIAIGTADSSILGFLSASIHIKWSLAAGSWLGVGNDSVYVKTRCLETYPFPVLRDGPLKQKIRDLGERLDAHRKRQQELQPTLTLTGLYNVLDLLRAGTPLDAKAKAIHDQGLVTLLKQIHDELDDAVLEAYGWTDLIAPVPLADRLHASHPEAEALEQTLLTRLVALNHERAAEEKRGLIRWLRPEYQAPNAQSPTTPTANEQEEIQLPTPSPAPTPTEKLPWPETLPAQVALIQKQIPTHGPDPETLSTLFGKKNLKRTQQITDILEILRALGQM